MQLLAALAMAILAAPLLAHPSLPLTDSTEVGAQHSSLLPRGVPVAPPLNKEGDTPEAKCSHCGETNKVQQLRVMSDEYVAGCGNFECGRLLRFPFRDNKWMTIKEEKEERQREAEKRREREAAKQRNENNEADQGSA